MIKAVFFDLDGTLLPMDLDVFTKEYLSTLCRRMTRYGYEPKELANTIWQGTRLMYKNDGKRTNEEVFWDYFRQVYGERATEDKDRFEEYYRTDFPKVRNVCGFNESAGRVVKEIANMGFVTVLATNPIFPSVATEIRAGWTGVDIKDFRYYTTYENSHYTKPNLNYYSEILERLNLSAEEVVMIGNDTLDDMIAERLGMKVFLVTDDLINKSGEDISKYPHGNLEDSLEYVKSLIK